MENSTVAGRTGLGIRRLDSRNTGSRLISAWAMASVRAGDAGSTSPSGPVVSNPWKHT